MLNACTAPGRTIIFRTGIEKSQREHRAQLRLAPLQPEFLRSQNSAALRLLHLSPHYCDCERFFMVHLPKFKGVSSCMFTPQICRYKAVVRHVPKRMGGGEEMTTQRRKPLIHRRCLKFPSLTEFILYSQQSVHKIQMVQFHLCGDSDSFECSFSASSSIFCILFSLSYRQISHFPPPSVSTS